MSYNPNIPQPTDNISTSQGQILTNFSTANTYFGTDHNAFNAASNQGIHKQVNLVDQTASLPSVNAGAAGLVTASKLTSNSWITPAWRFNPGGGIVNVPMAPIRAMAACTVSGGSVTIISSFNVSGISYSSAGRYVVTLSQNIPFTSISYAVIGSCVRSDTSKSSYCFLYSGQSASGFKININKTPVVNSGGGTLDTGSGAAAPDDPDGFSFVVLQI